VIKSEWKRTLSALVLIAATCSLPGGRVDGQGPIPPRPATEQSRIRPFRWDAGLTIASVEAATIAGRKIQSSTKLKVEWRPMTSISIDHYEIEATESIGPSSVRISTRTTPTTLTELKSGTAYAVTVKGCYDVDCRYSVQSVAATGTTSEEYWQIQGTGNSYATASKVVADGNIGAHAFQYGSWAGSELAGRLRLYYNPMSGSEKGAKPALTPAAASGISTVNLFNASSGFGLLTPCSQPPPGQPAPNCPGTGPVRNLALFQAVPMMGYIRFYFEANGTDQKNRILQIDSQDGYLGRDFNRGSRTICQTISDYAIGGECEARVAIGVEGDAVEGNPGIRNARQFKILYPTLDPTLEGRWDGAAGTAMVLTVNPSNQACSNYTVTQGYAIWNGSRWELQYAANGCPKLFEQMQAPNPVHLGGARYKLYYNNTTNRLGVPASPLTDIKLMKVFYADGGLTGSPTTIDFEDWESTARARNIVLLWPDGSIVNDDNESRFDDHVTLLPTRDPAFQVIYTNMSSTQTVPFIGVSVLVNP
jgi:hypothetical protein